MEAHVPGCFLGQTSRSRAEGWRGAGGLGWWGYRAKGVREKEERILLHYGASSIIQMDAVPLHLFSLLGLNTKMAAPKETEIQKMKPAH